jgi:predicted amidohydrolase YtcJ
MKTVLRNANIYTMNEAMPLAQAVVIGGDRILYVGPDDEASWSAVAGREAMVCDMKGKYIYPGMIDSHTHPGMVAQSSWHVRLPWTDDLDVILEFIRDYAEKHPKEEIPFLYFEYYPTNIFGVRNPHKKYLDAVCNDRPVMCQDFGEHQHWYNSKMLEAMGVTRDTPDPIPGLKEFVRDENGEPVGCGREFVHMESTFAENLYEYIGWRPPTSVTPELLTPFFEFTSEAGITAIGEGLLEGEAQMKSMYELDMTGKLHTYYDGVVRFYDYNDLADKINFCKEMNKKYGTKHLKINTMKLFLDGTNEIGNSALLQPHVNDITRTNYGAIAMGEEELKNCFVLCNRESVDLHIHIVGDRAFRVACNAVERAQAEVKSLGEKWSCQPIFAHCELVDPSDMHRPAKLGITINWSCHWSGGYFGEEALNYLTEEAWNRMYKFNPIIDSGALVTFSSDVVTFYELHRADIFFSMQVAATRVDPEYPLDSARYPGSIRPPQSAKLDVPILLKGYTINGAKQMRWGDILGSIERGKVANMNICSADIAKTPAAKLSGLSWDVVIFDGKVIRGGLKDEAKA